jgi:peptidoglycan/LPS O-acetylase OafA/YrhL
MLVFANHSGPETVFTSSTVNFLITGLTISIGEGALSYFFMLSGFVLTWSAWPGDRPAGPPPRGRAPNYLVTWTAGWSSC